MQVSGVQYHNLLCSPIKKLQTAAACSNTWDGINSSSFMLCIEAASHVSVATTGHSHVCGRQHLWWLLR